VESHRITVAPERPIRRGRSPAWGLIGVFTVIILAGTGLLMLPFSSSAGAATSPLTAFFTATSATFVTGLTVVDTATHWSGFGQAVILGLIEIGGIGYMTGAAFIILLAGRRVTLAQRQVLRITFGGGVLGRVDIEARTIIIVTLFIQAIGALALFVRFATVHANPLEAGWQSLFHSISAFNNAGFDITGGGPSLFEYREDPMIVVPIAILALLGASGIGAIQALALFRRWQPLPLDAKMVLAGSGILIVVGLVGILISEWANPASMGTAPIWVKLMDAFALSVGSRTSGFATFDVGTMRDYTLFLIVGLMFIGGASGSVAGGIKVNTFAVILANVWSSIRGRPQTEVFHREVPESQVRRAFAIAFVAFVWVNVITLVLSLIEGLEFIDVLFEVVSAFGLTGLSTGITASLSAVGQLLIVLMMFIGRLAPFLIVLELAQREVRSPYRYAREEVRIG
jgi:trk system potassium uptake protein TrkH